MRMVELVAPGGAGADTPLKMWQMVGLGALFSPVAAMLIMRGETWQKWDGNRPLMLLFLTLAGAVATFLCTMPQPLLAPRLRKYRNWGMLLIGLAAGAGLVSAAVITELASRWVAGYDAPNHDTLLFMSAIGMWNSLVLLYFDAQAKRRRLTGTQAQLRGLESQIRPHFFFNTLNTVSALIPEQPEAAQAVLTKLAGLMRKTLALEEGKCVALEQEVAWTREYLEIERARFGERLRYTLPEAAEVRGLGLPALTLQPLVENAVRHGIAKLREGGEVKVGVEHTGEGYLLKVANPVDDVREVRTEALLQEGHSLQIVAEKLRLLYRGQAGMTAGVEDGFEVTLRIPGNGYAGTDCRR